ncbi:MAG: hypothetical protein PHO67_07025 [Candidatus Omnitrophica bacterium]|nr:hypothetical protein [Candidatus Omnitrophota bacterium]
MSNQLIEEYKKINSEISNRVITLSLTVLASIFIICDKYGIQSWYLITLLGFILTIGVHLVSSICSSKHYELVIDGKIKNYDFRNSRWGIWAERLYWTFIVLFVASMTVFIIAILITIKLQTY